MVKQITRKKAIEKTAISRYIYIEVIVSKIKYLYSKNKPYDWYFDELLKMFTPLITNLTRKLYSKSRGEISSQEIRARVVSLIFIAVIRYDPKYNISKEKNNNFTYVYFSSYLKNFIPWEVMRILNPPKMDYDDLLPDPRNVELNLNHPVKEVSKRLIYNPATEHPISENFINLCKFCKVETKSDLIADCMMLQFGYGFKNKDIAKMLGLTEYKIGFIILELKKFWRENSELLKT